MILTVLTHLIILIILAISMILETLLKLAKAYIFDGLDFRCPYISFCTSSWDLGVFLIVRRKGMTHR